MKFQSSVSRSKLSFIYETLELHDSEFVGAQVYLS